MSVLTFSMNYCFSLFHLGLFALAQKKGVLMCSDAIYMLLLCQIYQEKGRIDKERYRTEMEEYKASNNLTPQY